MVLDKKYSGYMLMAIIILLLPFIYLIFFTHPVADDLVYGFKAKTNGLFDAVQSTYLTENGRYSGNFFIHLFPISTDHLILYRGVLLFCFVLFIFSFRAFIGSLLTNLHQAAIWAIALLGSLTYLSITTNIAKGFYWYTSVIYYQLSLSFFLLFISLVVYFLRQHFIVNKSLHIIALLFLELIVIGMNETIALTTFFLCFLVFLSVLIRKKELLPIFGITLLIAVVGVSFVIFSPGNEIRMASYENSKDLVASFLMSFLQWARFILSFIFSFPGLFFVLFTSCFYPYFTPVLQKIKTRYLVLSFAIIVYLCVFPSYYATGTFEQTQTLNIAALFFVILLSVVALKVGEGLKDRLPRNPEKMVLYFILFFFILGNGKTVIADLYNGDADVYNQELTKRYIAIKENKTIKGLYPLSKHPESIFIIDIIGDSTNWIDQSYLLEYQ